MITVCTVVFDDDSTGFFDVMHESVCRHIKPSPNFLVCNNGRSSSLLKHAGDGFMIINSSLPSGFDHGSNAHGLSLNLLISKVKTDSCLILESDVILMDSLLTLDSTKLAVAKKNNSSAHHVFFLFGPTCVIKTIDFTPKNMRKNQSYSKSTDVGSKINSDFCDILNLTVKRQHGFETIFLDNLALARHFGRGSNLAWKKQKHGDDYIKNQINIWKTK